MFCFFFVKIYTISLKEFIVFTAVFFFSILVVFVVFFFQFILNILGTSFGSDIFVIFKK